jgi:hypothetical protein
MMCRVGDVLEVRYKNIDQNGLGHNIDFHAGTAIQAHPMHCELTVGEGVRFCCSVTAEVLSEQACILIMHTA